MSAPEKFTVWLHGVVTSIGHNMNHFDKRAREDDYFKGMTVEEKLAASTCQPHESEAELRVPERSIKPFRPS